MRILILCILSTFLFAENYYKYIGSGCTTNDLVNYKPEVNAFDEQLNWHIYVPSKDVTVICRDSKVVKIEQGKSIAIIEKQNKPSYRKQSDNISKNMSDSSKYTYSPEDLVERINIALSNTSAGLTFSIDKTTRNSKSVVASANKYLGITFELENNRVINYIFFGSGNNVENSLDIMQCIIAMVSAVVNLEMKPEERKKILQDFGLLGSNTRFDKNGKETIYRSGHIFTLSKELGVISLEAALKK